MPAPGKCHVSPSASQSFQNKEATGILWISSLGRGPERNPGLFICPCADIRGKAIFRRRNTDDLTTKWLIQKSLMGNGLFPYTSQPFSLIHKSEKIFESG